MAAENGRPVLIGSSEELVSVKGAHAPGATVFHSVEAEDTSIDEKWLQQLLFSHPHLLPVSELEQVFAPINPLARELSTGVGSVDMLGVSSTGFLTIIETKLFRNPQSRREVLSQILDYCSRLTTWSYDDLVNAVKKAKHRSNEAEDPVMFAAKGATVPIADQVRFRATVSESLRHGRFLMMIVGDAFRDSTVSLIEYLQKFMHLQFTVRLVELNLYRPAGGRDYPVLVIPTLSARTQEITRAIVRIQSHVNPSDVVIEGVKDQETSPGLEGFMEALRKSSPVSDEFASFIAELSPLGVYPDLTKESVSLRYPDPSETGQQFRILRVRRSGFARFGRLKGQLEKRGYETSPAARYAGTVASWMPNAAVADTGEIHGPDGRTKEVPLRLLVKDKRAEFIALVKQLLDDIKTVGAKAAIQ